MAQSWVAIYGSVEVSEGQITLVPVPLPPTTPTGAPGMPYALVRSNLVFEQGTIEFEAWLPDFDSRIQIGLMGGYTTEFLNMRLSQCYCYSA